MNTSLRGCVIYQKVLGLFINLLSKKQYIQNIYTKYIHIYTEYQIFYLKVCLIKNFKQIYFLKFYLWGFGIYAR